MQTDPHGGVAAGSDGPGSDGLKQRTILLVEDEGFVREVAREILSSAGYCVLTARNAAEALLAFRRHREKVHLLLTDIVLPDRNGCELALELATLCGSVTTIFVSGYPENLVTRQGVQRPGWSYLPKPFSASFLLQKVREALEDRAPVRQP